MSDSLEVTKRVKTGKLNNRRLRRSGRLPAILYGHGEEPLSLSAAEESVEAVLRHGAQVVELAGDAQGQALLQHVQWDTFHRDVLHLDLLRVVKGERVTVEVPIQLRGEAPGERSGGVVELLLHAIEIETSPANIPEAVHVGINGLELGDSLSVADIEDMPEGAKPLVSDDAVVVQCVEPTVLPEEEEAVADGAEPEVIGGQGDEDGEEDDS